MHKHNVLINVLVCSEKFKYIIVQRYVKMLNNNSVGLNEVQFLYVSTFSYHAPTPNK